MTRPLSSLLAHDDKARLSAAPLDDAPQEDLRGPLVVAFGEQGLRDLEQLLVEHSTCLPSVTPASGNRQILLRISPLRGGISVFAGTRVPVQTVLDYLEAGQSLDDFLEGFSIMPP
jgi:hypothetical protein